MIYRGTTNDGTEVPYSPGNLASDVDLVENSPPRRESGPYTFLSGRMDCGVSDVHDLDRLPILLLLRAITDLPHDADRLL